MIGHFRVDFYIAQPTVSVAQKGKILYTGKKDQSDENLLWKGKGKK